MGKPLPSIEPSSQDAQTSLPLGAHLVTPRRGFTHHGIYAGNGRVIHYAGIIRRFGTGLVEEVSLERFSRGHGVTVKASLTARFPGAAAVERARSRLGERRYRLWSNNCEHLAEWSITGISRSRQVESVKARLRGALRLISMADRFDWSRS